MKEVIVWDGNPREMWVWDADKNHKTIEMVFFIKEDASYPVMAVRGDKVIWYAHCAEIGESKYRRMTNKELSRWIAEKPDREWRRADGISVVRRELSYRLDVENDEVDDAIRVRDGDGEWVVPFVDE